MASEITSAMERFNPERPVYLGGWWHLTCRGSVKTVRELLGIGAASCLLLDRGAAGHPGWVRPDCICQWNMLASKLRVPEIFLGRARRGASGAL